MTNEIRSVEDFAVWASSELSKADLYYGHGSQDAEDEAYWLASYVGQFNYADFEDGWENPLDQEQITRGQQILKNRIETKKPLAYLIKQIWFAGNRYYIDEKALVPRSHLGEWIPEKFEPWIDSSKVHSILDLCCGGGSIGIACALSFSNVSVDLADLSKPALEVAQRNIAGYQLADRVQTIHSDLFENVNRQYDLIVCNPPYVSFANMEKLPVEYTFEPQMALVSGDKGLDSIAIILNQVDQYLSENGSLVLEAGTAAPALEQAMAQTPLNWMMSASGESVVLIISASEIKTYQEKIRKLLR